MEQIELEGGYGERSPRFRAEDTDRPFSIEIYEGGADGEESPE